MLSSQLVVDAKMVLRTFVLAIACALLTASSAHAQQTLFNVPTAETAEVAEVFLQNQLTLGKSGDSEVTVNVGATKYLELGFNVLSVGLYRPPASQRPSERTPSILANAQLTFELSKILHLQLGTQQGVAEGHGGRDRADYSARGHTVLRFGESDAAYGNYVIGAYAGTRTNIGRGSPAGGMLGADVPLIGERLRLAGDWMIGTNEESLIALGFESAVDKKKNWEVSLAAQLPSPGSDNDYALIVQISRIPEQSPVAE